MMAGLASRACAAAVMLLLFGCSEPSIEGKWVTLEGNVLEFLADGRCGSRSMGDATCLWSQTGVKTYQVIQRSGSSRTVTAIARLEGDVLVIEDQQTYEVTRLRRQE